MSQMQEWWQGEARYYAYEVSRPTRGSGLQKSLHSFPDAMSMDEWVSSGARKTLKRKENQSDTKRYPIGLAHSDKAALYQVFGDKMKTKSVIRHSTAPSSRAPKPDPAGRAKQSEGAWVNVKIPKATSDGRPSLVEVKDASGKAVYALELPDGLSPVPVLPFRTKRAEPEPVDISRGTVLVGKSAKRPVEERGVRGWRAGVIKCLPDSDSYEVGFRRKAGNGDPWRVVVQLEAEPGKPRRKVAIASDEFASCLKSRPAAPSGAQPPAPYRYPHPSQFEQQPMKSPAEVRYLWQDAQRGGGRIEITHRIIDRTWVARGYLPESGACPADRVSTSSSFEGAYSSDFDYLAAHMRDVVIADPDDASKTYRNVEQLKAELGKLRPTHATATMADETLASTPSRARPMAAREGGPRPTTR